MKLIHSVCLPHETNFPKLKAEQELVLENAPPNIAKPSLSSQKIENAPSESHLLANEWLMDPRELEFLTLSASRSCSRSYSGTDSAAVSVLVLDLVCWVLALLSSGLLGSGLQTLGFLVSGCCAVPGYWDLVAGSGAVHVLDLVAAGVGWLAMLGMLICLETYCWKPAGCVCLGYFCFLFLLGWAAVFYCSASWLAIFEENIYVSVYMSIFF
ncbi:uncharacterized protein LOC110738421 [Chenopodium quinoa]|uniref:uncharacterized protein LOC110738421 n=1 Tax=Chenopodium quinoa TaxID=63459 RepID=UPI000B7903A1|nr:uncharacterized protein LOC110738421 [Chenopodium quinoa]XP_021774514.1 uncharacterized protein LOC110738421 [Chenopodium quinoa]XP_021774515.1 uncharacterized protein LOC110738421 [Chenopodium quinoa]XP_021774516.1 uncharacterized protein LOC110738421 [Chenopodium quinoa]XP_021774517.1 uncharacterized protein LOC110738421 [Chenopodium quinoa]XP_021774518.1 uncharacterized protein LOC110738421 [Chenopodium quinoa]XP_021774519.1 uncharacterized protein LOC110738421 [Chenopodium quinoa]XP_0